MGFWDALVPGVGLAENLVNANNQREMNDQNWIRQAQMYQQQRQDALSDRDFNNVYNSPASQMARLKAAGLNPNLAYGQGAVAQASQMPRGASPSGPTGIAPKLDLGNLGQSMIQMYQMGMIQSQQKLIDAKAITEATRNQLTGAQYKLTGANAMLAQAKIPYAQQMAESGLDIVNAQAKQMDAKAQIEQMRSGLMADLMEKGVPLQKAILDNVIKSGIVSLNSANLEMIKSKITDQGFINDVDKFRANMANAGINPNSPAWMTALITILKKWDILPSWLQ